MITLVLGGARSGKSAVAEQLAGRFPQPVTYIATTESSLLAADADMAARVAAHQARRPPTWHTLEAGRNLCEALARTEGTVLIDALGTWVSSAPDFGVDMARLCDVLGDRSGDTVVVSDEVGLGVHPSSAAGRRYRDVLGEVNQALAAVSDEVLLVIAGRTLRLNDPSPDDPCLAPTRLDGLSRNP